MILKSKPTNPVKGLVPGVALLPSTGEFVYSSTRSRYRNSSTAPWQNQNFYSDVDGKTDFEVALDHLKVTMPETKWASLIVSWFGDDLRIGECRIEPKTEHKVGTSDPHQWGVAGFTRATAEVPSIFTTNFYNGSMYAAGGDGEPDDIELTFDYSLGIEGGQTTVRVQHKNLTLFTKAATFISVDQNKDYVFRFFGKSNTLDEQLCRARLENGGTGAEIAAQNWTAKPDEWTEIEFTFNSGTATEVELQFSTADSWMPSPQPEDILIDRESVFLSEADGAYQGLSYGATPSDISVIEGIRLLKEKGYKVLFYPFILMDIVEGNGKPDPYGGSEQGAYPWRGRITMMPGDDATAATQTAVDTFFGTAQRGDWIQGDNSVTYTGPDEKTFRRMILHYAHLCVVAGGVDSFVVGTEMVKLTHARSSRTEFPAVQKFIELIEDCRAIMGPDVELSYAADWTEVCPYQVQDGTGDVFFHLDPLWAHPDVDYVGVDNYLPLSDWRDGPHLDDSFGSIYNTAYLMSQVEGGELYDYFYASEIDRNNNIRTGPITNWVYRVKDHKNWWRNQHFNFVDGEWDTEPTAWVPESKRFVYTEYGCAAIDKGTNQPNKFLDPKSVESTAPYFSNGQRDDLMQAKYYEAFGNYWNPERGSNPVSSVTGEYFVDYDMMIAWAWDGRPWPWFPRLSGVWADAENYPAGHWLGGRDWIER